MAKMNLLVPGTGGLTLRRNDGVDVGWPVMMKLKGALRGITGSSEDNDELIPLMGMEHRPGQIAPVKTCLVPGKSLGPGHLLRVAYNQVPKDCNQFLYDWRADLRFNARLLLEYLEQRTPTGERWNLITHSQGGLLLIIASKLAESETALSKYLATATLIAPPVLGTLNAAKAIVEGDNAGATLAPQMRKIIRMWPAIYQMLPAWDAVKKANGDPAAPSRQLTQPGGWPGLEGIDRDFLLRAREAQDLLKDPLSHMDGIDTKIYVGMNHDTDVGIERPLEGPLKWKVTERAPGDTLVPFDLTADTLSREELGVNIAAFNKPCLEHAYLLSDEAVMTHAKARLA